MQDSVDASLELNALIRYAASHSLKKKALSRPNSDEFSLLLDELLDGDDEFEESHNSSSNWINLVNKVELKFITDKAFAFFQAVEQVCTKNIHKRSNGSTSYMHKELFDFVMKDDNVTACWNIAAVHDVDEGACVANCTLKEMIVELWVTM